MTPLRPWHQVPVHHLLAAVTLLTLQVAWHASRLPPSAQAHELRAPPPYAVIRALAWGDPIVFAKMTMLWLQAFDTQAGTQIPLRSLDYAHVIAWLRVPLALDPKAQYPLLAASRFYAEVPDATRSRRMLEFVAAEFAQDPARRWPWLAHAVYLARHRLHDAALALRYARLLAKSTASEIPDWARQLEVFVLEDMGEIEAVKILLGALLASGKIRDPHERWFLSQRLHDLEATATVK